jgi:hypothetical protein
MTLWDQLRNPTPSCVLKGAAVKGSAPSPCSGIAANSIPDWKRSARFRMSNFAQTPSSALGRRRAAGRRCAVLKPIANRDIVQIK